ncbi:MAG: dTMP kinase [Methylobacter sp.]
MTGLFVFEGPDGVGKSTTITEVEKLLNAAGRACVRLSFPGNEPRTLGAHIYKLHHQPTHYDVAELSPLSLQILHVAAHIDNIERRILPLIREGTIVLLDRYWWSTWTYGIADGVPPSQLESIIAVEKLIWDDVTPTRLFLLSRSQSLTSQTIVDTYENLFRQESNNYPVIKLANEDSIESLAEEITRLILATC